MFIDTHCHLTNGRLKADLDGALARARDAGVVAIVCAAATMAEARAALGLANRHDHIYSLAGVHPHDAAETEEHYLRVLEDLLAKDRCVALGEIGLDYHYNYSPPSDQRRVFAEQLALARRVGAKTVIHTREAFDDTLAILADAGMPGEDVIFHSFTEGPESAGRLVERGMTISFSGIVTFRKADALREAARIVPDEKLLVETDAPFLSPEPVRKMRTNEPANVAHVARCLAELRGVPADQLAEQTTANASRFFQLDIA